MSDSFHEVEAPSYSEEETKEMSSKEYSEKLNELQSKILFTNISNLGKDVKKAEKTFFKEAKEKRKSLETACKQRNSRKI